MSDKAARLAETVKEALHFALSRTTDDPVQYRRIAAALAAVDELARVSREAEQPVSDQAARLAEWAECGGVFPTADGPVIRFPDVGDVQAVLAELDRVLREAEEAKRELWSERGVMLDLKREAERYESLKMTVRHVAGSLEGGNTDTDTLAATLRAALAAVGGRP